MDYPDQTAYLKALEDRGALPQGFRTARQSLTFFPKERPVTKPLPMTLNLLLLDQPTSAFAGVFTRNAFPGAPVLLGRELLKQKTTRGVLINNKISNVGTQTGVEDAQHLLDSVASQIGLAPGELFPASTGIIGWSLPVEAMSAAIPDLVKNLGPHNALSLAQGIMTTDAYPKVRSGSCGEARIVGVAKGAGMIEPNMATMLVYLMTDAQIPRASLRKILSRVVAGTFNCITVDSDQSTSDMCLLFSSEKAPVPSLRAFEQVLFQVCQDLAADVVRNGEGTAHVLEVRITGAPSEEKAQQTAKAMANSPLVKTAVFGNDPNVGRLLSSVGDYWGNQGWTLDRSRITLKIGDQVVFHHGGFDLTPEKEELLFQYFKGAAQPEKKEGFPRHERNVVIHLDLGAGKGAWRVYGSDLSYEYVRENADYRS